MVQNQQMTATYNMDIVQSVEKMLEVSVSNETGRVIHPEPLSCVDLVRFKIHLLSVNPISKIVASGCIGRVSPRFFFKFW